MKSKAPTILSFDKMFAKEEEWILKMRNLKNCEEGPKVGLALSGGGIRSATFNLGLLQGLSRFGLLDRCDYLSTVSGGGYIGGWLMALLGRPGGKKDVTLDTCPGCIEADEIKWLREHSNYLTPRIGALSADTWTVISTYVRNLVLNLLIIVAAGSAVVAFPHVLFRCAAHIAQFQADQESLRTALWIAALVLLLAPAFLIVYNLSALSKTFKRFASLTKQSRIQAFIVIPIIVAAIPASMFLGMHGLSELPDLASWVMWTMLIYVSIWFLGALFYYLFENCVHLMSGTAESKVQRREGGWVTFIVARLKSLLVSANHWPSITLAIVIAGGCSGLIFSTTIPSLVSCSPDPLINAKVIMTFGFPAIMLILSVAVIVQIGIMGVYYSDDMREWWSRLGALFVIYSIGWVALVGISGFGPDILSSVKTLAVRAGAGAIWLGSTAIGVLKGRSSTAGGTTDAGTALAGSTLKRVWNLVVTATPIIFVGGLLLLLSSLVDSAIVKSEGVMKVTGASKIVVPIMLSVGAGVLAYLLSSRVDVNEFSMHAMYRNRLVRCYLGASNKSRLAQPFTGFDRDDDFGLAKLSPAGGYTGPYPIINTTLNTFGGKALALQERKAESFVFTPLFSGYENSYSPTRDTLSLGTALAISGAATSPNMGYYTSKPLAFLMTVLNVRLGWWYPNPKRNVSPKRVGPRCGLLYLLRELSASTNDESSYVYLSDGGHFDNLGLYELVRRRCDYIIVSDAGADKALSFSDLGKAIEKCRVDLGADIIIDTSDIIPDPATGRSKAHGVVGRIEYGKRDATGAKSNHSHTGTLIYVKTSLTGHESADVLAYKKHNTDFPHESTVDQWFSESQFESYRKLGCDSAMEVLEGCRSNCEKLQQVFR
jgi:hypothetical protein